MNTTACVAPSFDQFGMQRRQHETAARSTMQGGQAQSFSPMKQHETAARSTMQGGEIQTFAQVKRAIAPARRTYAPVKRAFPPARRAVAQAKRTLEQVNSMKTAARSTMQEGQALSSDPAEHVLQPETFSPMKREGQVDVETAQTLHSEIFPPLDLLDISICGALLRNPRPRGN